MHALPQAMACNSVEPPLTTMSRAPRIKSAKSDCGRESTHRSGEPAGRFGEAAHGPTKTVATPLSASAVAAAKNVAIASLARGWPVPPPGTTST